MQGTIRLNPSHYVIVSTKTPDFEPKKEAETQACIRIVSDVQFLLLRQNVLLWREGMQRRVGSSSSAGSFLTMEMTELREGGLSQQKSHCTQNYSPNPTENLSGRRRYMCGSNAPFPPRTSFLSGRSHVYRCARRNLAADGDKMSLCIVVRMKVRSINIIKEIPHAQAGLSRWVRRWTEDEQSQNKDRTEE